MLVLTSAGNILPLTDIYIKFPYTYKIYSWAPICIGPFAYLYIKSVLHQSVVLLRKELLNFIPVLIYMVNRIPFYLLSQEEKKAFILNTIFDKSLYISEPEGMLPTNWAPFYRIFCLLIFSVLTFYELYKSKDKIFNLKLQIERNKEIFRFHLIIATVLFFGILVAFVGGVLHLNYNISVGRFILVSIWVEILVISLYLFCHPKILYGLTGWVQINNPVRSLNEAVEFVEPEEEITFVSIHKGRNIWSTINEHFEKSQSFTKIGYTISDLSMEVNIPIYLLSAVINQESGKNFNEFINDARVDYLKTFKSEDPNFANYSIEFIGKYVGFASRTSFITAVKKRTGLLPSEYLEKLASVD
ncbi:helix-turn-helix domain-containing protein [Aquirufa rosea]|uniref:AraC family transcriptional regulator n=1 Tax=Aquirufa rosea TaxID=2509241 RepID=A0A4Q1C0V8_9BACT|nr:helix-turn-helix domain-containing protein [Aquirufa rosea]RXK50684.1 AraC family transcriptional regulator [Aquirufa rosea]